MALAWDAALEEARYWELSQLAGAPAPASWGLPEGLRHTRCAPRRRLPARPLDLPPPGPCLLAPALR
jgi:hypothetical protein